MEQHHGEVSTMICGLKGKVVDDRSGELLLRCEHGHIYNGSTSNSLCSHTWTPLCDLAYRYCTDKGVGRATIGHSYTSFYYDLFKDKRESIKKVLELGTGTPDTMKIEGYQVGGGLRMWRDFFPNAQIYGADIRPDSVFKDDRIETFLCDLSRKDDLLDLINKTGTDVDVLIDDASHKKEHQILAALTLMPLLKKDVIYIIEDIYFLHPIRWELRHSYNIYEPKFPSPRSRNDRLIIVSHR
jgi:hypothetical protein